MYRDINKLPKIHYNLTLHCGGLGDLISQLPAIKYILDNHPQNFYHLWTHDYAVDLCKKLFGHHTNLTIRGLSESTKKYKQELPARSPYAHRVGNLASHLTEHAFYTMLGRAVEDEHKNYIQMEPIDVSSFQLPEKYIVVTTGFTSNTRVWPAQSINETCDYIISKGYTPVFLGKSFTTAYKDTGIKGNFDADYTKGISLIDKTSLFEAHAIMANSKCVIGCDNGLLHLSAMTNVPIIYAFTTVLKEHRMPYRNNIKGWNVYPIENKQLECFGCQSNMSFADTKFSFTNCFYKDYKCVELLTSDKFIKEIEKIL